MKLPWPFPFSGVGRDIALRCPRPHSSGWNPDSIKTERGADGAARRPYQVQGFPARMPSAQSAFTLVEIAIALAIIGFALVAIIGVLPMGIDVQKNNRRETIINQDANYLMDALRTGARSLEDLTNYVTTITNYWTLYRTNRPPVSGIDSYTNAQGFDPRKPTYLAWPDNHFWVTSVSPDNQGNGIRDFRITNGLRIMGILGTPKYVPTNDPPGAFFSNYVVVYLRALSGAAMEKYPQTNEIIREGAFAYRLIPEIVPYGARSNTYFDSSWTNYLDPAIVIDQNAVNNRLREWINAGRGDPNPRLTNTPNFAAMASNPAEVAARARNWMLARNLHTNLYDVRLLFRWPLLPAGRTGSGRQVYRTLFSGTQIVTNDPVDVPLIPVPLYFFQPRTFTP